MRLKMSRCEVRPMGGACRATLDSVSEPADPGLQSIGRAHLGRRTYPRRGGHGGDHH